MPGGITEFLFAHKKALLFESDFAAAVEYHQKPSYCFQIILRGNFGCVRSWKREGEDFTNVFDPRKGKIKRENGAGWSGKIDFGFSYHWAIWTVFLSFKCRQIEKETLKIRELEAKVQETDAIVGGRQQEILELWARIQSLAASLKNEPEDVPSGNQV